jgi:hypothetical protein
MRQSGSRGYVRLAGPVRDEDMSLVTAAIVWIGDGHGEEEGTEVLA